MDPTSEISESTTQLYNISHEIYSMYFTIWLSINGCHSVHEHTTKMSFNMVPINHWEMSYLMFQVSASWFSSWNEGRNNLKADCILQSFVEYI